MIIHLNPAAGLVGDIAAKPEHPSLYIWMQDSWILWQEILDVYILSSQDILSVRLHWSEIFLCSYWSMILVVYTS